MAPSATLVETSPASVRTKVTKSAGPLVALDKLDTDSPLAQNSQMDQLADKMASLDTTAPILGIDFTRKGRRRQRASTHLMTVGTKEPHDILNDSSATNFITGECCGGGCCRLPESQALQPNSPSFPAFDLPKNDAFKSLNLKLAPLSSRARLTGVLPVPPKTIALRSLHHKCPFKSTCDSHPPTYVKPHPPHDVYSAKIHSTRELTKPGAEKKTYHFDLDVTDYPEEEPGVDFRVGGAIGVVAPNDSTLVQEIFERLGVDREAQDESIILETEGGRWPTIWGDEQARNLLTTRRELLTWTVDVQSYPPTKHLLRLMAEYATDEVEKTILLYLCSRQGQAAFCELRTGPYVTLVQLLNAFPSSRPSLDHLLPTLSPLAPRFYSLSGDPYRSKDNRRIVEIAVSVHDEIEHWRPGRRTGVGSGFFERQARKWLAAQDKGDVEAMDNVRIPMFRGLMANPLAREFILDGPMILIGAGVGIAPFRGFVQKRLQNANCANKVWVLQGIRDSLLDELYSGEWGVEEDKIRKVVESRRGTCRYVQEEVRAQADLVWHVINAQDGRIFVCGSSKGMGEGVEEALIEVAMTKGRLRKEEAADYWKKKAASFQYITETW